jgi:hypothetical protein
MDTLQKRPGTSQKMASSGDGGSMYNYQFNVGEDQTLQATLKTFES